MFVLYEILTPVDVNTFEVVFPTSDEKARDDAIVTIRSCSAISVTCYLGLQKIAF
jgi:hypothetical protein